MIPYIKIGWSILYNWPDLGGHFQQHFWVARKPPKPPPPLSKGEAKEIPRGEGWDLSDEIGGERHAGRRHQP